MKKKFFIRKVVGKNGVSGKTSMIQKADLPEISMKSGGILNLLWLGQRLHVDVWLGQLLNKVRQNSEDNVMSLDC